jgi:outer membrane immunogenic protein
MSSLRFAVVGLAASALFTPAAWAADLGGGPPVYSSVKDAPYVRPFTWTGLYLGAHLGYGWTDTDWSFVGSSFSGTGSGGLLGGQIGYNIQSGRFVYGLEGDASSSWIDGSTGCAPGVFNCDHTVNWLASVRGRLGVTINDNRTLLYATAGVAWANADWTSRDAATGGIVGSTFSKTQTGWVAGAGIEHMLTEKLSARIEYLYYGFDTITAPGGTLDPAATNLDLSSQTVRFGLNLKF